MRLDKYVCEKYPELSRNKVQEMIQQGYILVNQENKKANYQLKESDDVQVTMMEDKYLALTPYPLPLDVRYEDKDVIVINKEKNIVVHPSATSREITLVHGLMHHCKDLSTINGVYRPGIVHRIDKDTTGLLIVAKNDNAHRHLSEQLSNKQVNRVYYALVHGVIENDFGTIDAPIGRDPNDRQKMCITAKNSKEAITHFKVVERFKNYTLVECRLETGRTHQIRVHMQYIKHPIVGDQKYSYRKTLNTNGQMLHAHTLHFIHPTTNEIVAVYAELPEYFKTLLEELRHE